MGTAEMRCGASIGLVLARVYCAFDKSPETGPSLVLHSPALRATPALPLWPRADLVHPRDRFYARVLQANERTK